MMILWFLFLVIQSTCLAALNKTEMSDFLTVLFMGKGRIAKSILERQSVEDRRVFVNHIFSHRGEESAVMRAIRIQRDDLVNLLLKHGANPHWENSEGVTAIMYAARYNRPVIFHILVSLKASFMTTDHKGQTILMNACIGGSLEIVNYLIEEGFKDLDVSDETGTSPIIAAAESNSDNSLAIVKLLIENGIDIEKRNYMGFNALLKAVSKKNIPILDVLVKAGAKLHAKNSVGPDIAVFRENFNFKKQPQKDFKSNALIIAAKYTNSLEIVKHLVEGLNFSQINEENYEQETAVMWAVHHRNLELVKYLVEIGVDPTVRDRHGDTAITMSIRVNHRPVIDYFKEKGYYSRDPGVLEAAAAVKNLTLANEMVEVAVKEALDYINPYTKASAMTWATRFLDKELLQWFLDRKAVVTDRCIFNTVRKNWMDGFKLVLNYSRSYIDLKDSNEPLLFWAVKNRNMVILHTLLKEGALTRIRNPITFETPFLLAARLGNLQAIKLLHQYNANIHALNKFQEPAWIVAERYGHLEVRDFILKLVRSDPNISNMNYVMYSAPSYAIPGLEEEYEADKSVINTGFPFEVNKMRK